MSARIIYLHGFASSPASRKARFFQERLAEVGKEVAVPDLAPEGFRQSSISRQLGIIEEIVASRPSCLIGSSLGGYVAALAASRVAAVERLVLLAPAFCFADRWREYLGEDEMRRWETTGTRSFYHYDTGRDEELDYTFYVDAVSQAAYPEVSQPALVFHGAKDDVVPVELSREWVRRTPSARLREVDSDHGLLDAREAIWASAQDFLAG